MLFWAYYFGYEDYPGDPQKALKYAKKGSDAADPICGLLYAAYSDISQDEKLELLRKVRTQVSKMADANDSFATLALGACYFQARQYDEAQKALSSYEKAGGVLAYEMLGLMKQYVKKQEKTALIYYKKAVKNKIYHAYILMGDLYWKGSQYIVIGRRLGTVSCDCDNRARECYKKATEHNQGEAAYKLAETISRTCQEKRDYWFALAEKQGYKKDMKSWTSDIEEFNH